MGVAPFDLYNAPVSRPRRTSPRSHAKVSVVKRNLTNVAEAVCVFAMVLTFTYGLSVLTGKSFSEKERRDAYAFTGRARTARFELGAMQQRYDLRANPRRISDWAKTNGFERDSTREASQ